MIPKIRKVILVPAASIAGTVKVTDIVFEELLLVHRLEEAETPTIVTVQVGEVITNKVGKVRSILGVVPSGCPSKKLKEYTAVLDIIEVSVNATALEKLNDVASAVKVWVSCIYSELLLLNRKDSDVGVWDGGSLNAEHSKAKVILLVN